MANPAECTGSWQERYPTEESNSTDQLFRCDGCGDWMFINNGRRVGTIAKPEPNKASA